MVAFVWRCPGSTAAEHRRPVFPLLALAAMALVLLGACRDGEPEPQTGATPTAQATTASEAALLAPTPTTVPEQSSATAPPAATDAVPQPGEAVAVHLSAGHAGETELVVRTEQGVALERFRFAGARQLVAEPGGSHALVGATSWAVYDAQTGDLGPLPLPGRVVTPEPGRTLRGEAALFATESGTALLVHLPTRTVTDLTEFDVPAEEVTLSGDGTLALVGGTTVLDVALGEPVAIPGTAERLSLASDGSAVVVTRPASSVGATAEAPPTTTTVEVITPTGEVLLSDDVAGLEVAVALPGARALVRGEESFVLALDGRSQALDLPSGLDGTVEPVSAGTVLALTRDGGWHMIDLAGAAPVALPSTSGLRPHGGSDAGWWFAGPDANPRYVTAAGEVVDPGLPAAAGLRSLSADGALATAATENQAWVVTATGMLLDTDGDIVDAVVSPDGRAVVLVELRDDLPQVLLGSVVDDRVASAPLQQGSQPAWLAR